MGILMSPEAPPTSASEVISKNVKLENIILSHEGNLHFADAVRERPVSRETQGQVAAEMGRGI